MYECTKVSYSTRKSAERAMKDLSLEKRGQDRGKSRTAYCCRHCGCWHWGHQPDTRPDTPRQVRIYSLAAA